MVEVSLRADYKAAVKKLELYEISLDENEVLGAIGQRLLRWIGQNFRSEGGLVGGWKPLTPGTIAGRRKKGRGAKILRDTGRLQQSFVSAVSGRKVEVGSAEPRADWHHFGTKPYTIRPVSAKLLRFMGPEGKYVFSKEVHHPGLPARKLVPPEEEAEKLAVKILDLYVNTKLREIGVG